MSSSKIVLDGNELVFNSPIQFLPEWSDFKHLCCSCKYLCNDLYNSSFICLIHCSNSNVMFKGFISANDHNSTAFSMMCYVLSRTITTNMLMSYVCVCYQHTFLTVQRRVSRRTE